jgi:hypothetical protein
MIIIRDVRNKKIKIKGTEDEIIAWVDENIGFNPRSEETWSDVLKAGDAYEYEEFDK